MESFLSQLKRLEENIIRSSDMIIAVTLGIMSYVKKIRKENVKLSTNGISLSEFPTPTKKQEKKKKKDFCLCWYDWNGS